MEISKLAGIILSVYELDLGMNRAAIELRKLFKLTDEHISLNPRLRMRVNLAAQVINNSPLNLYLVLHLLHLNCHLNCLRLIVSMKLSFSKHKKATTPFSLKLYSMAPVLPNDCFRF